MYVTKAYDDGLREILDNGVTKENRTGVRTRAIFGLTSRYKLDSHFPIITGRKVWPKAVFAELLWFISGSTLNRDLKNLGADFWSPWEDEEWAKKNSFLPDAFGPVYGFQLRHFGGFYGNGDPNHEAYGQGGIDQLSNMVETLKNNPDDRRNLFSLWNPQQTQYMRLPPCHYTFQCFVHDGKLSTSLTQRSCDFPVGVPANVQFYSALTMMLAQQANLEPYEFVHYTVDAHIYEDQLEGVEEYLNREKPDSPQLQIVRQNNIFSYGQDDFDLVGYKPQPPIKFPVAV